MESEDFVFNLCGDGLESVESARLSREAAIQLRWADIVPLSGKRERMIHFLKNRMTKVSVPKRPAELGRLELNVMDILWDRGRSNVRDVVERVGRPLAYTTVMTTLDRLFKKGFLNREKVQRAFVYVPRLSREEWEQERAGVLVAGFLQGPEPSRELLLSCFLEAVGEHDAELLDQLEKQIRMKRKELAERGVQ